MIALLHWFHCLDLAIHLTSLYAPTQTAPAAITTKPANIARYLITIPKNLQPSHIKKPAITMNPSSAMPITPYYSFAMLPRQTH